jgi:hypothetical protein
MGAIENLSEIPEFTMLSITVIAPHLIFQIVTPDGCSTSN